MYVGMGTEDSNFIELVELQHGPWTPLAGLRYDYWRKKRATIHIIGI
jgi:hypothetical protein